MSISLDITPLCVEVTYQHRKAYSLECAGQRTVRAYYDVIGTRNRQEYHLGLDSYNRVLGLLIALLS